MAEHVVRISKVIGSCHLLVEDVARLVEAVRSALPLGASASWNYSRKRTIQLERKRADGSRKADKFVYEFYSVSVVDELRSGEWSELLAAVHNLSRARKLHGVVFRATSGVNQVKVTFGDSERFASRAGHQVSVEANGAKEVILPLLADVLDSLNPAHLRASKWFWRKILLWTFLVVLPLLGLVAYYDQRLDAPGVNRQEVWSGVAQVVPPVVLLGAIASFLLYVTLSYVSATAIIVEPPPRSADAKWTYERFVDALRPLARPFYEDPAKSGVLLALLAVIASLLSIIVTILVA